MNKKYFILLLLLLISVLLFFGFLKSKNKYDFGLKEEILPDIKSYQYVLMGDTGTGGIAQHQVAEAIVKTCNDKGGCEAGFILGDVIYNEGVKNLEDIQFVSKFEKPYESINFPFYISYGNHDYLGCKECYIDYEKFSKKWRMADRFYYEGFENLSFYIIDTENFNKEQQEWLRETLEQDINNWIIVLGHRPLVTYEETKTDESWTGMSALKEIICKKADFYISGHSHVLEDVGDIKDCRTKQLVSGGGGAYPRKTIRPYPGKFFFNGNGFLLIDVNKDSGLETTFFNTEGKQIYITNYKK